MKKGLIYFFALMAVVALGTGCNKDDDCTAPSLSENIVGTWTTSFDNSEVEFKADGTLIDPNDAIIGGEINGTTLDEKSYTVSGDTLFTARAESGSSFVESDFEVTSNECDRITISVFGFSGNLNRK